MNTNDLKYFGQEARKLLMGGVSRKLAFWGFNNEGFALEEPSALHGGYIFRGMVYDDPTVPIKWNKLQEAVKQNGFIEVVEKAAYVWFNRLIALQILGKNEYDLPQLEPASADEATPLILKRARQGQYGFLNPSEQDRLKKILTDYENETQAFAILLIGYCHHHTLLNNVFGGIDDYTELLLPDDILAPGGFLDFLNNGGHITDEDYTKVELIGWLYQFYITEKKAEVFKKFKANKKAEKEDIPAATQIFTPNWIVKYMVENTVGRIWLDLHPTSPIREQMKYLVEPSEQTSEQSNSIIREVKELKLLDPAVGSGHILVEGFELLYDMYMEELYPADEAVESILQHNLFGLDIDVRAAQLAQFAVLMKAAQKYPGILQKNIIPHVYAMPEPVPFTKEDIQLFLGEEGKQYLKPLQDALHLMLQAQNLGAIMQFNINVEARAFIVLQLNQWQQRTNLDLFEQELLSKILPYLQVLALLTQKYEAIAANPPYMGRGNMNGKLKQYVEQYYPNSKSDLYTVFIDFGLNTLSQDGRLGLINPPSWMFNISYRELRARLISNYQIQSFLNFGRGIFGADFGAVSYVVKKSMPQDNFLSVFRSLFRGKSLVDNIEQKRKWFNDKDFGLYKVNQLNFLKIDTIPISYFLKEKVFSIFSMGKKLELVADAKQGMATSDNDRFRRDWQEISFKKVGLNGYSQNKKWFPYNSGGEFRKWYGNQFYVINWENQGKEIKEFSKSVVRSPQFYFKEAISWSKVTIGGLAFRYFPKGFIFDVAGCSIFSDNANIKYLLGLLNSTLKEPFVYAVSQSVNYEVGVINNIPIINSNDYTSAIEKLVEDCISISAKDWDRNELSWNFTGNDLIAEENKFLVGAYQSWLIKASNIFYELKKKEEELNTIFLKIYNLSDDYETSVPLKNVTLFQQELIQERLEDFSDKDAKENFPIKKDVVLQQLISYVIGCYMGRYRLVNPGLQIAHPNPTGDETASYPYTSPVTNQSHIFNIDEDAIIPLMGKKSIFTDDIVKRFQEFVQIIWGDDTITQNLNFVQECLNRQIEDYLLNHFWKYHVRVYNKKPIYWLFASKRNAFQVLVYMHRMNRFTVEKIRDKYLLKHIQHLQQQIQSLETKGGALTREEQKKLDQLRTDELECSEYELVLKDVATHQIEFDLDDGVTKNYALFHKVVAPIK